MKFFDGLLLAIAVALASLNATASEAFVPSLDYLDDLQSFKDFVDRISAIQGDRVNPAVLKGIVTCPPDLPSLGDRDGAWDETTLGQYQMVWKTHVIEYGFETIACNEFFEPIAGLPDAQEYGQIVGFHVGHDWTEAEKQHIQSLFLERMDLTNNVRTRTDEVWRYGLADCEEESIPETLTPFSNVRSYEDFIRYIYEAQCGRIMETTGWMSNIVDCPADIKPSKYGGVYKFTRGVRMGWKLHFLARPSELYCAEIVTPVRGFMTPEDFLNFITFVRGMHMTEQQRNALIELQSRR
ncbi:MAG: hypothetical protein DHS20C11_05290 [Lysobacteraceae bacterium]|nr:MAG: hypothetical protein DHS20C11_05290 [Xanthomonadaceae bacterium]